MKNKKVVIKDAKFFLQKPLKIFLSYYDNYQVYETTAYCSCKECSGCWGNQTSTGRTCIAGRTVAVDPSVIPYGTEVYIEGIGWRIAEDTGGGVGNKHIDVLVDTHENALSLGVSNGGVWVLVKK